MYRQTTYWELVRGCESVRENCSSAEYYLERVKFMIGTAKEKLFENEFKEFVLSVEKLAKETRYNYGGKK